MPIGLVFWILMLLWLILDLGWNRRWADGNAVFGSSLMLYILLFLLGWHSFGFILQGR